jgi:propanol-preferring alcohol dehydrogenase
MAEKMNAMVLDKTAAIETNPLRLKSIAKPSIKSGDDLLIEIEACGVCRSNLHLIEGDWEEYGSPSTLPIVPGHEVVGIVRETGSRVRNVKKGDRVGIQPLFSSCLRCEYCKDGREHLCDNAEITGETVQGGYAEYISAKEGFVTAIPDSIDSEHAAPLFCPGITAYKAVKAAGPAKGKSVGVFGIGGVGHLAIQMAKMYGSRVVAVSRTKRHLDLAKKLGADNALVFSESEGQFLKHLRKGEGGLLDSAIVFAPSNSAIDVAISSVKKGGTVVIGVLGSVSNFPTFEEKIVKGSVIGSRNDMKELVELARTSDLKVVIETQKLKDANKVLARLKNSQVEARAVLVP